MYRSRTPYQPMDETRLRLKISSLRAQFGGLPAPTITFRGNISGNILVHQPERELREQAATRIIDRFRIE